MKRLLLLTCILVTVVLAGALHGHYKHQDNGNNLSLQEAYRVQYPETIPTISPIVMTTFPF
jgi:hypothetical protein